MSPRKPKVETPAQRIEAIRRSLPPAEGRRSRLGYLSKDDFADLLGAGRSTVINWTTGKAFPEERYRIELARLSGGQYAPEDFENPQSPGLGKGSLERRLKAVEATVVRLERHLFGSDAAQGR